VAQETIDVEAQIEALNAPPRFIKEPREAVAWLIESESQALQKLQDAIEPTGREAASEAIEHRLEHIILRKQEQVGVLLRASRR